MNRSDRTLVIFFLLAFAITWICFITVAVAIPAQTPMGRLLVLVGAFAPAVSALLITRVWAGTEASRQLLSGLGRWQIGVGWFVFAASYTVVLKLTVALVHWILFHAWPSFDTQGIGLIPFAILLSWPFQVGEELGWRGFALPRMAERMGLPRASLVLGALWASWHLPQFYIAGGDTYRQSFLVFFMGVTALSVLFAWVHQRTKGSLPLLMLMHAAYNNSKDIVPSASRSAPGVFSLIASRTAWLTVLMLWAGAGVCLWDMWRASRR